MNYEQSLNVLEKAKIKNKQFFKVIILGSPGVGKTALMTRYTQEKFTNGYRATIGADFMTKKVFNGDKEASLQIWDTAGQERFQSLGVAFYRGSDACFLVYDITDPKSFNDLDKWYKDFVEQSYIKIEDQNDNPKFPFFLVGNKGDLERKRTISKGRAETWAEDHGFKYYEVSALNGNKVSEAFNEMVSDCFTRHEQRKKENVYVPPIMLLTEEPENKCCPL